MTRPVLVGMNNPLSSNPEHALYPLPAGCTGNRIFNMLAEHVPDVTMRGYRRCFDRRNLVNGKTWSRADAKAGAYALWCELDGRSVCLLGQEVARIMNPVDVDMVPLRWYTPMGSILEDGGPARVCLIPHPSGMNRWYNEDVNRVAVGLRLEQLYTEWKNEEQGHPQSPA